MQRAGQLSLACAISSYWMIENDVTETGKPVNLRFIQGSNHFVGVSCFSFHKSILIVMLQQHFWDHPEEALKIYLECSWAWQLHVSCFGLYSWSNVQQTLQLNLSAVPTSGKSWANNRTGAKRPAWKRPHRHPVARHAHISFPLNNLMLRYKTWQRLIGIGIFCQHW